MLERRVRIPRPVRLGIASVMMTTTFLSLLLLGFYHHPTVRSARTDGARRNNWKSFLKSFRRISPLPLSSCSYNVISYFFLVHPIVLAIKIIPSNLILQTSGNSTRENFYRPRLTASNISRRTTSFIKEEAYLFVSSFRRRRRRTKDSIVQPAITTSCVPRRNNFLVPPQPLFRYV